MPLVSIICLCYNHDKYVGACLQSVLDQSYEDIQIIIVDDGSTDGSKETISNLLANWLTRDQNRTTFINLEENVGNCRAFNKALAQAKGRYVIDLATDDVLDPYRVAEQVQHFEQLDESFGVVYTDAEYIDTQDKSLGLHRVPDPVTGDVYLDVVSRYFIPPPTMMMRRRVLDELSGYDESLAYEDFDFWVRSARHWKYSYLAKSLTKIRKVSGSLSTKFYEKGSPLAESTYQVCLKIQSLNRSQGENEALAQRIRYERRQCALLGNWNLARRFGQLLSELANKTWGDRVTDLMVSTGFDWFWLLRLRHASRFKKNP